MSIRDDYEQELILAFIFRFCIFAGGIALLAIFLAGCSTENDRSRAIDLAVKGAYTTPPGNATGTRNQIPQGGIDEKSGNTPTKSVD